MNEDEKWMNEDEKWMNFALKEAKKAQKEGEVPVGAILVKNGLIIAKAYNQPISKNDVTAHAEIQVLRAAGKKLKNYRLTYTTLYVTLEPCKMCFEAITHARVERIVFGAYDSKNQELHLSQKKTHDTKFKSKLNISGGVLETECRRILISFFKIRRKNQNI
jgi:tRNA(adenine34) deaminase